MKKLILLLFLTISSLSLIAQDTTFNKLITSYPGTFSIRSLLSFNKAYYACVSQRYITNNIVGLGILKFDSTYTIVDSCMYQYPYGLNPINNNGHGFDINTMDTSFIFCGAIRTQYTPCIKENGYLVKFDKNLDTLWTLQIAHPDTAYADTAATPWVALRDVKVTPSGNYIVVGNYNYHCQGNRNRSFIIKMDSDGAIIWYKLLPPNIAIKIMNFELDITDLSIYFVTYVNPINPNVFLVKMDSNANHLWSSLYSNNQGASAISSIKIIGNKVMVAWALEKKNSSNVWQLFLGLSSINKQTHTINWEKTFLDINIESNWLNQETIDIEVTPLGNMAIGSVGRKNIGNHFTSDFRAQILMLTPQGQKLWSHYYTYNDNSLFAEDMQFNDMVVCPDGGLLFGGDRTHNAQFLDAWLVKTDSMGYCPYAYTVSIEQDELILAKNKLSLYPNPATNNINLGFEQSPTEAMQLSIYNTAGQLVLSKVLNGYGDTYCVNIEALALGVYFVHLSSETGEVFRSKFVKR